jgi:hypothetical protein
MMAMPFVVAMMMMVMELMMKTQMAGIQTTMECLMVGNMQITLTQLLQVEMMERVETQIMII